MIGKFLFFVDISLFFCVIAIIPKFYTKIWFLYFNIFILLIVLSTLIFYSISYREKKNLIAKFKIVIFIIFILQIVNIIFNFYSYFFNKKFKPIKTDSKNIKTQENVLLVDIKKPAVIKGKIYNFINNKIIPVKDARIVLKDITTNKEIAIFYSDFDGKFEYKIDEIITQNEYVLNILYDKFKTYSTKINLVSGIVSELEILLPN